jgi:3-dehydroquinate dehydratase type I
MRLCSSLGGSTASVLSALSALDAATDMVEVRVDLLAEFDNAEALASIFAAAERLGIQTIATVRELEGHAGFSPARRDLLLSCIDLGATYADLEVEAPPADIAAVAQHCKGRAKLIVSHHNYAQDESASLHLDKVLEACLRKGADVAKVAVHVGSARGAARVLALYDSEATVVAIGMGAHGQITRLAAASLGAPFSFVAVDEQSLTAPGQLTRAAMRKALAGMGRAEFESAPAEKRAR